MNDESGARIRAARIARGMSQGELASAVGVSQSYLSHIEAGRRAVAPKLRAAIADALGVESVALELGVPATVREDLQLKLRFAEMALRNGSWASALEAFSEVLDVTAELSGQPLVREATWGRARALEATGDVESAIQLYESLWSTIPTSSAVPNVAVCTALVRAYSECGDLTRAVEVGEAALRESASTEGVIAERVELLSTVAGCYLERGDLTRARLLIDQAIERADADGSPRSRAAAAWNAAVIAQSRRDWDEARRQADRALALYQELDHTRAVGLLNVVEATILLRQDEPDPVRARTFLDRAGRDLEDAGTSLDLAYVQTELARSELLLDHPGRAKELAEAALEKLEGDRLQRGHLLMLRGHAARAVGESDLAIESFRAAAEELRVAQSSRQAARAWRELGEAYSELGLAQDALDALRHANDLAGVRAWTPRSNAAAGNPVRH